MAKNIRKTGFSLVEILVAVLLAAIFLPALGLIYSLAINSSSQGDKFSRAYALAQKDMETVFYAKSQYENGWDWAIDQSTGLDEYYQPLVGGELQFINKVIPPDTPIMTDDPFTRKTQIGTVTRCGFDICDGGIVDNTTRKITVFVTWMEQGKEQVVKLEAYVTRH